MQNIDQNVLERSPKKRSILTLVFSAEDGGNIFLRNVDIYRQVQKLVTTQKTVSNTFILVRTLSRETKH
jgi:hypothetical protein